MENGLFGQDERLEKTVTVVEADMPAPPKPKRVAAYARVSSGKDEMLHSLSAQVSYFNARIQAHPGWVYAGTYVDEALTDTKGDRPAFTRMLDDCRAGKIDIILTKSISRFARNTVTLLTTVRELRAMGVGVRFEEQHIDSMGGEGELLLTILAAYAQAGSLSVSDNCKWRICKQFEQGIPKSVRMLGYEIRDGVFTILPEEAKIVRMVFADYLRGMGRKAIIRKLTEMGVKSKLGGDWHDSIISAMLRNEKYAGDLMLQKYYREDHLTKKDRRNEGEFPRWYVKDHHEAIVDRETFDKVQERMRAQRARYAARVPQNYPFTGMLICGNCGACFRRKIAHGIPAWVCNTYAAYGKVRCPSKKIPEDILLETTASVLGLDRFDEGIFDRQIAQIRVPEANHLLYVFHDGHTVERTWKDKSRRDSWTDDMRAKARETAKRRR